MAVTWGQDDIRLDRPKAKKSDPGSFGSWGKDDTRLTSAKPGKRPTETRTSQMLGFRKGLMKPLNKGAEWLEEGAESLPFGVGDTLRRWDDWVADKTGAASSVEAARANQQEELARQRAKGVRPGKIGEFVGETVGTLPVAFATRNPWIVGGVQGGLLGDSETPEGLLADVAGGAVLGKVGDVAVGKALDVATPLARRATEAAVKRLPEPLKATARRAAEPVRRALEPVRRALPPKPAETTGPVGEARRYVLEKARTKGLSGADDVNLKAATEFADHPDVRLAELMGKEGEGILQALTVQGGDVGDEATAAMLGRLGGTAGRTRQHFADMGVDPVTAEGDIVKVIEAAEERARPLYQQMSGVPEGANAPGIWNDELAGLASDPLVADALQKAGMTARRGGGAAEGLTYGRVDIPGAADDLSGFVESGVLRRGGAKGEAGVTGGTPLLQFIGRSGGLKGRQGDETLGELLAMDADKWHRGKPFMNRLVGPVEDKAHDLDRMAELAFDAGYFPERVGIGPPDRREFLDALRSEMAAGWEGDRMLRGTRFARGGEAVHRRDGRPGSPDADELAYYGETHPDDLPNPEQYGDTGYGAPPETEPAYMEAPTAESWDLALRKLNKLTDWRPSTALDRNAADDYKLVSGRLNRALGGDEKGVGGAIPGFRAARDAGGEPIRMREAYRDFTGALFSNSRQFKADWERLKPGDQEAARAALATEIMDRITSGKLKPQQFGTEDVRANLTRAFGDKADAFLTKMQAEARLVASGQRFIPDSGSRTQRLKAIQDELHAGRETDSGMADLIDDVLSRGSVAGGALAWMRRQASGVMAKAKTAGLPVETRNEIGRLMLLPKEQAAEFLAGPPQTEAQRFVKKYLLDRMAEARSRSARAVRTNALQPPDRAYEDEAVY